MSEQFRKSEEARYNWEPCVRGDGRTAQEASAAAKKGWEARRRRQKEKQDVENQHIGPSTVRDSEIGPSSPRS
jgi:hypothetical protein